MEKKCKKAKRLSEEALQIAVKRREAKSKGEKERYSHLNAEFQRGEKYTHTHTHTHTHICIYSVIYVRGVLGRTSGRESACNAGDMSNAGSVLGLGRSPGGGHGNSLQYSCLEDPFSYTYIFFFRLFSLVA